MNKPTPGRWYFEAGDPGDADVGLGPTPPAIIAEVEGEDFTICMLFQPIRRVDREPTDEWDECVEFVGDIHANGRLIEAAPDLLAACQASLDLLDDPRAEVAFSRAVAVVERLRAAVAKATEQEPPTAG